MKAISSDDEIEALRRRFFEGDGHAFAILLQRNDGIAIDIGCARPACVQQEAGEIVTQDFDVPAIEAAAAEGALFRTGYFFAVNIER